MEKITLYFSNKFNYDLWLVIEPIADGYSMKPNGCLKIIFYIVKNHDKSDCFIIESRDTTIEIEIGCGVVRYEVFENDTLIGDMDF